MKKKTPVLLSMLLATLLGLYVFSLAEEKSVSGHSIRVDGALGDWVGSAPEASNTSTISHGEYIWRDAIGDDTGNGKYTYPLNRALRKGCDLREFRVTYDRENLYLLIRCDRPGEFWAPLRIIGIDEDGAEGGNGGTQVLAQGDIKEYSSDSGTFSELKVAPELACEYVIAVSGNIKGRIWDSAGALIARVEGVPEEDTPGFNVLSTNWNAVEVAIPLKLIGSPLGRTWRFIVAIGQQDYDVAREIHAGAGEWHGGGGETSEEDGVDPDVYDLAGSDKSTQEQELGSYKSGSPPGDKEGFATIDKSYLVVSFGGN